MCTSFIYYALPGLSLVNISVIMTRGIIKAYSIISFTIEAVTKMIC